MTDTQVPQTHAYEEDEISLLDILVILAESWKLLVFGPVVVGLLVGALSFLWPKTYESVAVVRLSEQELGLLNSAPVLDPLIAKFDLLADAGGVQDDARDALAKKIVSKVDKKTGLATITVAARTPEQAKAMADAALESLFKELLPKGKNKDQIEKAIRANELLIAGNTDAVEQLRKQIGRVGQGDSNFDAVMKHYAVLNAEVMKKELENFELRESLVEKGDEAYVQRPNLPQRTVSSKRSMALLLAVLLSGFALLMFVFMRKAWQQANVEAESAEKIKRIKAALGMRDLK